MVANRAGALRQGCLGAAEGSGLKPDSTTSLRVPDLSRMPNAITCPIVILSAAKDLL